MSKPQTDVSPAGAGVQALIDRLRTEGVTAGQAQAEEIVAFAKAKADKLVAEAEARARETLDRARREAAAETAAGQDALKVAARDLVLKLRNELGHRISEETKRLLGETLMDEEFLKRLVLAMAAKATKEAGVTADDRLEILLPDRVVTFEDLQQSPEDAREGTLTHFVVAVAAKVLRKGVTFSVAPGLQGIRVRLVDRDLSIDVTEEAVATLLGKHLQPRFRALMEGVAR